MGRKQKRKVNRTIATVLIIAALLFFGYLVFTFSGDREFDVLAIGDVPEGCNIGGSASTNNEFPCEVGRCDVNGWDSCNSQTGVVQTISFRTNAQGLGDIDFKSQYKDKWVVLNLGGSLIGFIHDNHQSSIPSGQGCRFRGDRVVDAEGIPISTPRNLPIYWDGRNSALYIYNNDACNLHKFIVSQSQEIDKDPSSKEPYKSNNQEVVGGESNSFQCEKDWRIESNGVIKESGKASYSGSDSGDYQTGVKRLLQGEKFIFSGKINYALIDTTKSCSISLCSSDNKSVIECVESGGCMVESDSITPCLTGEVCVDEINGEKVSAFCSAPFDTDASYSGVGINENIPFEYSVTSEEVDRVSLFFLLLDPSGKLVDQRGPVDVILPTTQNIVFNGQLGIGDYNIVVRKSNPITGLSFGEDEEYRVRVGGALTLTPKHPDDFLTGSILLTNSSFHVDVIVRESGISTYAVNLTTIAFLIRPDNTEREIETGIPSQNLVDGEKVFTYIFNIDEPGQFKFEATASRFGVFSNLGKTGGEIKDPTISVLVTNLGIIQNSRPGIITINFETKDSLVELIPTENTIKIKPTDAPTGRLDIDVTELVQSTVEGEYSFSYLFEKGSYFIEIESSSPGIPGSTIYTSPPINVDPSSIVKDCAKSEDCGAGEVCSDGKCKSKESPILLYIIIGLIVLIVLIIIISAIFLLRRKKRPVNGDISIGGGL